MIQAGLAALGQGRPPPTDPDGGREGRHHGLVRQNPRNQGLRTAHFSGDVLSVHCCHTLFVKPRAQPRHTHSTQGKHRVSQGPSGPAQPPPHPGPRSSGPGRPCPCPRSWRTGVGLPRPPTSPAGLPGRAQIPQRPEEVPRGAEPALSQQVRLPDPRRPFLSTQVWVATPTPWPQPERSRPLRLRIARSRVDGRGRGGHRSRAW